MAEDPRLRQTFKRWSADLLESNPKPEICWEFIVSERNLLLKEYQSYAGQRVTAPRVLLALNLRTGEQKTTRLDTIEHHYTINDGIFMGRVHRDLVQEAFSRWYGQLEMLEKAAIAA